LVQAATSDHYAANLLSKTTAIQKCWLQREQSSLKTKHGLTYKVYATTFSGFWFPPASSFSPDIGFASDSWSNNAIPYQEKYPKSHTRKWIQSKRRSMTYRLTILPHFFYWLMMKQQHLQY